MCVLQYQETPLHKAALKNQLSCLKILYDRGALVDAKGRVS